MPEPYDIVLIGDFRFPGGTSSAVAEEIKANAAAGYRTALLHLEATNLSFPFAMNQRVREQIDAGRAELLDPATRVETRLALIHNPYVMARLPWPNLRIRAEERVLVAHHPPFDAVGEPYYDAMAVDLHAREVLGGAVRWAPVGPKVRASLSRLDRPPPLTEMDWVDVFDLGMWAGRRRHDPVERPVLGRHSRPDPRKWPDTREEILAAYPDDPAFRVRILGVAPFLLQRVGLYPRNWEVLPFGAESPQVFLNSLDFFVYFHSARWVEAFGCTIGEALASGTVAVLPPDFEELFGPAAVYVGPADVASAVAGLHADPRAYRRQRDAGREVVEARFSHAAHRDRIARLIGAPRLSTVTTRHSGAATTPLRRVLFVSSNGVGMGHLTRLLAIARRLPAGFEAVFATMSQAVGILRDAGHLVEYLPYHQYLGCDIYQWNRHLRRELNEIIAFYDARVVVCDFNSPFQGVIDAAADNRDRWFVWCRRGMWRAGAGGKFIAREKCFDVVLEPRDLAGDFDLGLTARSRDRTRTVDPIRLLDRNEMLPREAARRELGLDPGRPAVIFLLGSGNNFDYSTVRRLALDHLARREDVQVVVADWLMSEQPPELPDGVDRIQRFPLARWLQAFDAAVSAVGYNSFHELLFAAVPSLFIPNENPQQDDQLGRARWAARNGFAQCLRTNEVYGLKRALDRLLDSHEQASIRHACAGLDPTNGAEEASRTVVELAHIRRADRLRD